METIIQLRASGRANDSRQASRLGDGAEASAVRARSSDLHWEALYEALGERVFRLLHRMMRDPEEAADLTHDAFVRIHGALRQYDGSGSVEAWVFRIAANVGRDALRRRQVRAAHSRTALEDQVRVTPAEATRRLALERALARLDEQHRIVLLLHDVDGYTHPEIAEMLEMAVGTSRARLSRARRTMRAALGGDAAPADREGFDTRSETGVES